MHGGVSSLRLLCLSMPPAIVVESRHFLKLAQIAKHHLQCDYTRQSWPIGSQEKNSTSKKVSCHHNRNKQHGSKSTNCNLQTWPFKPTEKSPCFLRGPLERMTQAKTVRLLKFLLEVIMFLKCAAMVQLLSNKYVSWVLYVKSQTETHCLVKHLLYWKLFAINVWILRFE